MALRPAKCDEKSVVISRLSGRHFDPLFLLSNGRNKIHLGLMQPIKHLFCSIFKLILTGNGNFETSYP